MLALRHPAPSTAGLVFSLVALITAAGAALGFAPSARGALSGTGWTVATLPANYAIGAGVSSAPVSCVTGTGFCVVIAEDVAPATGSVQTDQAALVSTDSGATWTGYPTLPTAEMGVTAVSCPTTSVCWVTGWGNSGQAQVAKSTDGGKTWADVTPAQWTASQYASGIDCVTASVCWVVGWNAAARTPMTPWAADTTDGGTTWTTSTNLPAIPLYDPNGSYALNAISCVSALSCVAVGGLNYADGLAQVISTTDGGATWTRSTDPTLSGLQQLFSVSCLPVSGGLPLCRAAADALQAAGPVAITSADGGATWSGVETADNTGWLSSMSCADAGHCWAAGAGTTVALLGTATGGSSWSAVTSNTTNELGNVSCASVNFCVATNDNALWVTSTGGGLTTARANRSLPGVRAIPANTPPTALLPRVSGATVWARSGGAATLTGQYRGTATATRATAQITLPNGAKSTAKVAIGLNGYYSLTLAKVATGLTAVRFTAGNARAFLVSLHGHPGPAPVVTGLPAHAGPVKGGNTVTITGSGFTGATGVFFGAKAGTKVKVISPGKLTVTAPAGTEALYVTVTTATGGPSALTGSCVYNFLPVPVLTGLVPKSGPPGGGTTVTITGSGLAFVKAVRFGNVAGTHLVVLSPDRLMITAPAGTGTVDITVTTAGGTSAKVALDRYTY